MTIPVLKVEALEAFHAKLVQMNQEQYEQLLKDIGDKLDKENPTLATLLVGFSQDNNVEAFPIASRLALVIKHLYDQSEIDELNAAFGPQSPERLN